MSSMDGGIVGSDFVPAPEVDVRYPATPDAAWVICLEASLWMKRSCFCCAYCFHTGLSLRMAET
jgi:hypothetical protein